MLRKRIAAIVVALAGAAVLWVQHGRPLPFKTAPVFDIPAEHKEVADGLRQLLKGDPQASDLGQFYLALAEILPKLPATQSNPVTAAQARAWLQAAVTLRYSGEFKRVPGLAEAIHGQNGVIARIYGLEAGQLDVPKLQAALRAVAWACLNAN